MTRRPASQEGPLSLPHWEAPLELLNTLWPRLRQADQFAQTRRLSDRAFDEAKPSGERLYLQASMQLASAEEHLAALQALLQHHGATPMAPWTMLRPVLIGAFHALWALEPHDSEERRRRGLRLEVINYAERRKWIKEYEAHPEMSKAIAEDVSKNDAEAGFTYRKEALAVGLDWSQAQQPVQITNEIKKLRTIKDVDPAGPAHYSAAWRSLSGFSHGYGWAMINHSNLTEEVPVPGGALVKATIKDDSLDSQGQFVLYLLACAAQLYIERSLKRS